VDRHFSRHGGLIITDPEAVERAPGTFDEMRREKADD